MGKCEKDKNPWLNYQGEKRNVLLSSVADNFGSSVQPWGDASGLHIALQFPGMDFEEPFIRECRDAGIRIASVAQYCPMQDCHKDKLLVGYGHLSHVQIQEGIRALHKLIC